MGAVIDQHFLDGDIGIGKHIIGRLLIANRPFEDMVGMFARPMRADHLVLYILAEDGGVPIHRFERIDDAWQRLVHHVDQFGGIRGDVAILGDDESDFLVLEQHLVFGQHSLNVAGQGRHVMQAERLKVGGGQNSDDTRQSLCPRGIDADDAGMGMRRTDEIAKQHAGQLDVVDIVALALGEAYVFDALALAAHALELFGALGAIDIDLDLLVHSAASR